jgi:hypothetical protein
VQGVSKKAKKNEVAIRTFLAQRACGTQIEYNQISSDQVKS